MNRYACLALGAVWLLAGTGGSANAGEPTYYFKTSFTMKNSSRAATSSGVHNVKFQALQPNSEIIIDTEFRVPGRFSGQTSWDGDYEVPGVPTNKYCRVSFIMNFVTPNGATGCYVSTWGVKDGYYCAGSGQVSNRGCAFSVNLSPQ